MVMHVREMNGVCSIALAAALCAVMPVEARALDGYPSRPVKIIAPVSAGAVADLVPRVVAEKLSAKWGQPVLVENRPGGGTNIGAEAVANAEPDGYTLLVSPSPALVSNQSVFAALRFDPAAFVPVTVLADQPNVLVAHPNTPAANLRELIAYAKANPDKLSYASSGIGTMGHLGMEMLKTMTGIKIVNVPYKGLTPALNDLLAGRVDVMFDNLGTSAPHIASGRLKAIGIGAAQRHPRLPQLPALSEEVPGMLSSAWFAMVAPPKTPPAVIDALYAAVSEALKLPDVQEKLARVYATPVGYSPAETATFFDRERQRWHSIVVSAGIRAE
jgi:tripartite-type tricarboxylate transporter receptor subunit TctC